MKNATTKLSFVQLPEEIGQIKSSCQKLNLKKKQFRPYILLMISFIKFQIHPTFTLIIIACLGFLRF